MLQVYYCQYYKYITVSITIVLLLVLLVYYYEYYKYIILSGTSVLLLVL